MSGEGSPTASSSTALDALFERRGGVPRVTWTFLALCLAVTLPSMAFPSLYDLFGGIAPRHYPWQLFTAVFEHGWPGFPAVVHLGLDSFLILECGRPCERLLGSGRFLGLSLASAAANAVAQLATEGANGSSLVIWAWGPALYLALRAAPSASAGAARLRVVLGVMYLGVTLVMPLIPYALGWRGNPLYALVMANLHHLVATAVGVLGAWLWRRPIARRLEELSAARPEAG